MKGQPGPKGSMGLVFQGMGARTHWELATKNTKGTWKSGCFSPTISAWLFHSNSYKTVRWSFLPSSAYAWPCGCPVASVPTLGPGIGGGRQEGPSQGQA